MMSEVITQEQQPLVAQTPMDMLSKALSTGMDADTLKGFMELHRDWEAAEAQKAFNHAMTEFKANPPTVTKSKQVAFGNTSYSHATLEEVSEIIGAGLSTHGLRHSWAVSQADNTITVTCVISHGQGHSESVSMSAPPDDSGKKNSIQQVASTVTYLERYTLLAATGIAVKDQDSDGVDATPPPRPTITKASKKLWDNAKNAYKRDGNLKAVLARADMSKEDQEALIEECDAAV